MDFALLAVVAELAALVSEISAAALDELAALADSFESSLSVTSFTDNSSTRVKLLVEVLWYGSITGLANLVPALNLLLFAGVLSVLLDSPVIIPEITT